MQNLAAPVDDGLIYGAPYDHTNPMHVSAMAARAQDRRIQMERDAAIARTILKYNVTLENAREIYYYHYDEESVYRNARYQWTAYGGAAYAKKVTGIA